MSDSGFSNEGTVVHPDGVSDATFPNGIQLPLQRLVPGPGNVRNSLRWVSDTGAVVSELIATAIAGNLNLLATQLKATIPGTSGVDITLNPNDGGRAAITLDAGYGASSTPAAGVLLIDSGMNSDFAFASDVADLAPKTSVPNMDWGTGSIAINAFDGDGLGNTTVNHNLGVEPESVQMTLCGGGDIQAYIQAVGTGDIDATTIEFIAQIAGGPHDDIGGTVDFTWLAIATTT